MTFTEFGKRCDKVLKAAPSRAKLSTVNLSEVRLYKAVIMDELEMQKSYEFYYNNRTEKVVFPKLKVRDEYSKFIEMVFAKNVR